MLDCIKGKLGFGCMRLPMVDGEVDLTRFSEMVDFYLASGFNYFDTASGYLDGKSETAIRECLVKRYPRESFILTNKLSNPFFNTSEEIIPFFERQLAACGVDYFDFYLMHSQDRAKYKKYKELGAYETALKLKKEGRIRHFGISFHDGADMLETILSENPEIEVVQIQFNYADYDDGAVQSRRCYEVCRKYGKSVLVMEPVKGGNLAKLPLEAAEVLAPLGGSAASYAIRFAAGFDGVVSVLSGMGDMDMMRDNVSFMQDFRPLDATERAAVERVRDILHSSGLIPCTACGYCLAGCPVGIKIPDMFACLNSKVVWKGWTGSHYYEVMTGDSPRASECIGCGACEDVCPQHLEIRSLLRDVSDAFDKKKK